MIESPVLDEVKEILRNQYLAEGAQLALRRAVVARLEARFGSVPTERIASVNAVTDETRLRTFVRLATTCPNLDSFAAELAATS